MCTQLDLEVMCKRPKKKYSQNLIFMNFGMKKFTVKTTQKYKNFDVQML
jgi:hypothetical protein